MLVWHRIESQEILCNLSTYLFIRVGFQNIIDKQTKKYEGLKKYYAFSQKKTYKYWKNKFPTELQQIFFFFSIFIYEIN